MGKQLAVAAMTLKMGRQAFKESGLSEPELIPFTTYSVRPKKGSYADKLVKEGRLKYISKEEIEARKASREKE